MAAASELNVTSDLPDRSPNHVVVGSSRSTDGLWVRLPAVFSFVFTFLHKLNSLGGIEKKK